MLLLTSTEKWTASRRVEGLPKLAEDEFYRRHGCYFRLLEVSCVHTKLRGVTAMRTED